MNWLGLRHNAQTHARIHGFVTTSSYCVFINLKSLTTEEMNQGKTKPIHLIQW